MDKQLLKALDNLSVGLEKLAEALQQKGEKNQSDTSTALQAGDFNKSIEQISVEIKSIKTDTQEILKKQDTLIALFKQKKEEKKSEGMEEAGDPKKTGMIKKGVATILLIAIAVLAIGMAFKLVGNVNILSVLALGIGIVLVAYAFEKVAKITGPTGGPMTIKEAFAVSAIMVVASLGMMISSWILSKISPLTIPQVLTAATISLLFTLVAPAMSKLIAAMTTTQEVEFRGMKMKTQAMSFSTILKASIMLPLLMVTMSLGIMLSSKILSKITPISIPQALTAILIGVMFALVAKGIAGLITSLTTSQEAKGAGFGFKTQSIGMGKMAAVILGLPLVMFMIAKGIAWSSHTLGTIKPISFMQAVTAILIAGMFAVVSMGIAKLINALDGVNPVSILLLPVAMVAIALAIALSAKIFANYKSSFDKLGWGTIFKILLLGASIGVIAFIMSFAVKKLGGLDIKTVLLLPLMLSTMALAVAISAWIFAKDDFRKSFDKLTWPVLFKVLLLGATMAIVSAIMGLASKFIGQLNMKTVILLPVMFTLLALAIAVSAFIIAKFKSSFDKLSFTMIFKVVVFGIAFTIAAVAVGLGMKLISKILKLSDLLKGGIMMIAIAGVIALTSRIISMGKYDKYPKLKWTLGVVAAVGAFAIGLVLLGTQLLNPLFWMGLPVIATVAGVIVGVSHILSQGKYNLPGFLDWAKGTALLFATFTPIILIVGAVAVAAAVASFFFGDAADPISAGGEMLKKIAWTIVDVSYILSLGKYKGGPTESWAKGISIAIGAFSPIYAMLVRNAVFEAFGAGGVGPNDFAEAIKTVSLGIVTAAWYFARNKSAFLNGPPLKWAKGVSAAIGGFAPVFIALNQNTGWFTSGKKVVDNMVYGIKAITWGIVEAAYILSKNKAPFKNYPDKKWGKGVGEALKAFNPVFDYMFENSSWWGDSDTEVIDNMRYGMRQIAYGIVDVAGALSFAKFKDYPSKEWAQGIEVAVHKFFDIMYYLSTEKGIGATQFAIRAAMISSAAWSMASTADAFYYNRKAFNYILPKNWIINNRSNIIGFAKLALELDKLLVSEKTVTSTSSGFLGIGSSSSTKTVRERKDLSLARDVAFQMASVAQIFFFNKKFFNPKIAQDVSTFTNKIFSPNGAIMQYAKLALRLNQMSTGSSIWEKINNASRSFSLKKFLFDSPPTDAVSDMARRMVAVADIFTSNAKKFSPKVASDIGNWFKNISTSIMGYVALNKWIKDNIFQKVTRTIGFKSKWLGDRTLQVTTTEMMDLSLIPMMAEKLVDTAVILNKGNFNQKIDPFYVRKIGQNLIDFTFVTKKIAEAEGKGTSFLGRLGQSFESAIGSDPISQVSRRLVTLAKGYDAMATALIKLGAALRMLKLKDLTELGSITKGLSSGNVDVQKISPVKTKTLFSVSDDKKKRKMSDEEQKKNEILYVSKKLDEAVSILKGIRANTGNIDNFVTAMANKPKKSPELDTK